MNDVEEFFLLLFLFLVVVGHNTFIYFYFFVVLRTKPSASYVLGMCSTTELQPALAKDFDISIGYTLA